MDRPLGRACGNALEIEEAIARAARRGAAGPHGGDLRARRRDAGARRRCAERSRRRAAHDGERDRHGARGRAASRQIIEAQGGNPAVVDDPALLPQAAEVELVRGAAPRVRRARRAARGRPRRSSALGGGRTTIGGRAGSVGGLRHHGAPGRLGGAGEPMATIFARDRAGVRAGAAGAARRNLASPTRPIPRCRSSRIASPRRVQRPTLRSKFVR